MSKTLIIGGAGFVGKFLTSYLKSLNYQVFVTKMPNEVLGISCDGIFDLDILDQKSIEVWLEKIQPDWIFHLAAQSSVGVSWKNPDLTIDVNIKGATHVMEAMRTTVPNARLLLIGSGEEYGYILPEETPVSEETVPRPGNIYAATKVEQNLLGKIFCEAYGLDILSTRSFNHIGPGQAPIFVVSDFSKQIADIEAGKKEPVIRVGNLSAKRDFTNVQDVVRAYELLMRFGIKGETYNIGSGKAISIDSILKELLMLSNRKIEVQVDEDRLRPIDIPVIEADIRKLQKVTNWKPEISMKNTLLEVLNYWRAENE